MPDNNVRKIFYLISLHKYLYCYADPINRIDPEGEFSFCDISSAINIGMKIQSFVDVSKTVKSYAERVIERGCP